MRVIVMRVPRKRRLVRAAALVATIVYGACAPAGPPPMVVPASSVPAAAPGARLAQFAQSVRSLKEQADRARAVAAMEYAGIQMSLADLADAIQLLPRGADVLATSVPADAIRNDALRVGSPVLDDPTRTVATKRALDTAAHTLDLVAKQAYAQDRTMSQEVANLARAVQSVDESRILGAERTNVLDALESAVAVLEHMERAERLLSTADAVRR